MFTGEPRRRRDRIGAAIGLRAEDIEAELMPQEKFARISAIVRGARRPSSVTV